MPVAVSRFLSQKFRFYTFTCIALLLFVHGYNLNQGYLMPSTTVSEPLTCTTWIEYFLANGILRFRIPLLFIISGYIYGMKDRLSYTSQVKSRAVTLLIPYLIWSAIALLITYAWQRYPLTARAVAEAGIDQLGDNRPYEQIGVAGILYRWVWAPVAFQLWFILALFVYNVFYPAIRWAVVKWPVLWCTVIAVLWVSGKSFFVIDGRGLLFFSVGILLQKKDINLEKKPKWLSMYIVWLVFVGFCVIKSFMAFELDPASGVTYWVLNILHESSIVAGIAAVWFGLDQLVKWCMRQPAFVWASSFSFFIFGLHVPLVIYMNKLFFIWFSGFPNYRLVSYFVAPVIVIGISIFIGALVRRFLPRIYGFATGGRGFRTIV